MQQVARVCRETKRGLGTAEALAVIEKLEMNAGQIAGISQSTRPPRQSYIHSCQGLAAWIVHGIKDCMSAFPPRSAPKGACCSHTTRRGIKALGYPLGRQICCPRRPNSALCARDPGGGRDKILACGRRDSGERRHRVAAGRRFAAQQTECPPALDLDRTIRRTALWFRLWDSEVLESVQRFWRYNLWK